MANALNVRLINNVTSIAQGDNASTVILELLDNNRLIMPFLNGKTALINFISTRNEIQYQTTALIFDSRIEFNVDEVIPHGKYNVEVRVEEDDSSYVFPSSVDYKLTINKSANDFYNVAINVNGVDLIVAEVYQRLESENPGLLEHVDRKDNPHQVTAEQVGLGNVDNVKQATKTEFDDHADDTEIHVTDDEKEAWNSKATQEDIDNALDNFDGVSKSAFDGHINNTDYHFEDEEKAQMKDDLSTSIQHVGNTNNPHQVTKEQVGLSNVLNVEQASKEEFDELKDTVENIPGSPVEDIPLTLTTSIEGAMLYGVSAFIRNNVAYISAMLVTPEEGALDGNIVINGIPDGKRIQSTYQFAQVDEGTGASLGYLSTSQSGLTGRIYIQGERKHNAGYVFSIVVPIINA